MRKLNKKGMTLMEIIVSVALISIVLIFLMNLFTNVRSLYNQSKIYANYDMLNANIVKIIGDDINNYGLKSMSKITNHADNSVLDEVLIEFNEYRATKPSDNIKKVVKLYQMQDSNGDYHYYLSYGYDDRYTQDRDRKEMFGMTKMLPDNIVFYTSNKDEYIKLNVINGSIYKLKIPLSEERGNVYDINIYGVARDAMDYTLSHQAYKFEYDAATSTFYSNNANQAGTTASTTITFNKRISYAKIEWRKGSPGDKLVIKRGADTLLNADASNANQLGIVTFTDIKANENITITYYKAAADGKQASIMLSYE